MLIESRLLQIKLHGHIAYYIPRLKPLMPFLIAISLILALYNASRRFSINLLNISITHMKLLLLSVRMPSKFVHFVAKRIASLHQDIPHRVIVSAELVIL